MIFKLDNSKYITYKKSPGVYTFEDLSYVLSRGFKKQFELRKLRPNHIHDKSDSIIIESDNVTLITKLILRYELKVFTLDKKSLFNSIPGFLPYFDDKSRDDECYSEKKTEIYV